MSTPTALHWTDMTPPQKGWYAQAISSSGGGAQWVFPGVDYVGADGFWDNGPRSLAAIAGPFANATEAWRWAQDHMASFAEDEMQVPHQAGDWQSILTTRLRGEVSRRRAAGDDAAADLMQAAANLLHDLAERTGR